MVFIIKSSKESAVKILSVDDSKSVRHVIGLTVELLGYELLEAENGIEGIAVLEQHAGDVAMILLDWNMPEMDGLTFLKTIKADDRFKHIPVTMVTTETEKFKMIEAIKCGAKTYVSKPFSQETLVSKISECLGIGF
jgi:two-component system chemotaxis response regulator CheY